MERCCTTEGSAAPQVGASAVRRRTVHGSGDVAGAPARLWRTETRVSNLDGLARRGIAYVLEDFPIRSETFIAREVHGLARAGVPIALCRLRRAFRSGGFDDARRGVTAPLEARACLEQRLSRLDLYALARSEPRGSLGLARWAAVAARFALSLRGRPPALIHAHFALGAAVVARFLGQLLRVPWGVSVHAQDIYGFPDIAGVRLRGANYVVACSERAAEDVRLSLAPCAPVHVVHHGLELTSWSGRCSMRAAAGEVHVLGAGRLVPKKGFDTLVRAIAELRAKLPSLRCTIAGDGPERNTLVELAARLRAPVAFVGWRSEAQLREHYAQATCLAAPCRVTATGDRDNIPNVIIEAMALGLPVVASAIPALRAVVRDQECLLIEPSSPGALAAALEHVCTRPIVHERLSAAGRRCAELHFDQSRNLAQLIRIFGAVGARPPIECVLA